MYDGNCILYVYSCMQDIVVPHPVLDDSEFLSVEEAGLSSLDHRRVDVRKGKRPKDIHHLRLPEQMSGTLSFSFPLLLPKNSLAIAPLTGEKKVTHPQAEDLWQFERLESDGAQEPFLLEEGDSTIFDSSAGLERQPVKIAVDEDRGAGSEIGISIADQ